MNPFLPLQGEDMPTYTARVSALIDAMLAAADAEFGAAVELVSGHVFPSPVPAPAASSAVDWFNMVVRPWVAAVYARLETALLPAVGAYALAWFEAFDLPPAGVPEL
jgi:hypothetical protein